MNEIVEMDKNGVIELHTLPRFPPQWALLLHRLTPSRFLPSFALVPLFFSGATPLLWQPIFLSPPSQPHLLPPPHQLIIYDKNLVDNNSFLCLRWSRFREKGRGLKIRRRWSRFGGKREVWRYKGRERYRGLEKME